MIICRKLLGFDLHAFALAIYRVQDTARNVAFARECDVNEPNQSDLAAEMASLKAEVVRLNKNRFVRLHRSIPGMFFAQFLRGLAFGLGSVVGATILVSFLVYALSQINFIPVIGEWAKDISDIIQAPVDAAQ